MLKKTKQEQKKRLLKITVHYGVVVVVVVVDLVGVVDDVLSHHLYPQNQNDD